MFLTHLADDPHFFVYVVVTMVISVVLHELAHGWAAIWQGDRTPIELGHMTIDPRVHMGAVSLLMLCMVGTCFGAMPVDPRRFRHRLGHAFVAAAGPLMNLLLAFVALSSLGVSHLLQSAPEVTETQRNLREFVWVFGYANVALFLFNLLPIPPLDGATVLAGFHRGYARLVERVQNPMVFLSLFMLAFALLSSAEYGLYAISASLADGFLRALYTVAGRG